MTLQEAIRRAMPFAGKSTLSSLPIIEHVLIADVRVVASDITCEAVFAAENDGGIEAAIPVSRIAPLVDILDQAVIDPDGKGSIIVRHGKSRYRIPTLPARDFPRIFVEGQPTATLTLPAGELGHRLATALVSAANNDVRHYLNGVLIERKAEETHIIATDGHRMIVQQIGISKGEDFAAILPREAVGKIIKQLGEADVITLSIFNGLLCFEAEGWRVLAKRIDGRFPDWRRVMPHPPLAATCETAAIIDAARRAAKYSGEKFNGLRVEIGKGEIAIEALGSADGSEARAVVEAETAGTATFGINASYLIDALRTAESERVGIYSNGNADAAIRIEPEPRRADYIHVVMPLRM